MKCPKCGNNKNGVINTGASSDFGTPRIRKCKHCKSPFQTVEVRRDALYHAIKQLFDEGTPVCILGDDFCEHLVVGSCGKPSKCGVLSGKKSPLRCRAFHGK